MKNTTSSYFARQLIRYRIPLSLLTLLIACMMLTGITGLKFSSAPSEYIKDSDPRKLAFFDIADDFVPMDRLVFIVDFGKQKVFEPKNLSLLEKLDNGAQSLPHGIKTESLINTRYSFVNEQGFSLEPLFADAENLTAKQMSSRSDFALTELLIRDRLVSKDGHIAAVFSYAQWENIYHLNELIEIVEQAQALKQSLLKDRPDIDIYLTGEIMIEYEFFGAAINDITVLFPIIMGFGLCVLWLLIRSLTIIFATVSVVLVAIMFNLGLAGYLGVTLGQSSALVPMMIFILGVAQLMHILINFIDYLRLGHDKENALEFSLQDNLSPILLTSVTTTIGFLGLSTCDSPVFVDLGLMSAMGIATSFFICLPLLTAALLMLPLKTLPKTLVLGSLMPRISNFVIMHRRRLFLPILLMSLFCASFIPLNTIDNDMVRYFDQDHPIRKATEFASERLVDRQQIMFSIDTHQNEGINELEFLQTLQDFRQWLERQPEVSRTFSYEYLIKRINRNLHGDQPEWNRLPESRELAAQYLMAYEMSMHEYDELDELLNSNRSAVRLTVILKYQNNRQMLEFEQRCLDWLSSRFEHSATTVQASSLDLLFANLGYDVINSMILGSVLTLVMVTIVITIGLGSWRFGLLSIVPNVFPSAIVYGLWGLMIGEINMAVAVSFSVSLGVIVDDTVHILSKFLAAVKSGHTPEEAIRKTFRTTGIALISTTIILVGGLLIVAQSVYGVHATLGLLVSAVIAVALLFDFYFLPGLLLWAADRWLPSNSTGKEPSSGYINN